MMKTSTSLAALALALSCSPGAWAQDKVLDLGKQAYQECIACHSVKAGENGVGPSLAGVFGTKAGEVPGFRFSGPMKRSGLTWDAATLDKYLENPQAWCRARACPTRAWRTRKNVLPWSNTSKP